MTEAGKTMLMLSHKRPDSKMFGLFFVLSCNCMQPHLCQKLTNMPTLVRKYIKIGRNEPCPCGSGKKFKLCCEGKTEQKHDQLTIHPKQLQKHIAMTNIILDYLKTDRDFDTGVRIYQKFGKNNALLRKFNLQGETPQNLELLHTRLYMLTGLPDKEFHQMMLKPVEKQDPVVAIPAAKPVPPPADPKPAQPVTAVEAVRVKLRDEFPFLSEPFCPDDLKILVADMITAYENYVKAHKELFDVTDEKNAFEVADKLIENYLDNQAIWKELNHFKNTGKILGEHSHFSAQKRKGELMKKSVPELIKLKEQLEMNIWRNRKKLTDDPRPNLVKSRQESIAKYEVDLKVVKSLLNINE